MQYSCMSNKAHSTEAVYEASKSHKQVVVRITWRDGEVQKEWFDSCEEAWNWEADIKRKNAKRRAKADRRFIEKSVYAGCTCTGKDYGGFLTKGHRHNDADYDLSSIKQEARIAMRRHLMGTIGYDLHCQ